MQDPLLQSRTADKRNSSALNEDARDILNERVAKDRKRLFLSSPKVVPIFLVHLLIVLPIWLVVLLPITLVVSFLKTLASPFLPKEKSRKESALNSPATVSAKGRSTPRQYDLVVFGATGFSGRLCATYLANQYGNSTFKWAIAGRRKDALEALRAELAGISSSLSSVPIILADSTDEASMLSLVLSTKVVISTAGPFAKYGSLLVKLCAENGTHYCDITGETDWVRELIDKYDDVARASGAHIVPHCGHDCIPWDLLTLELSKKLKKQDERLEEVHFYDEIVATASGGTLASIALSLSDRVPYKAALGYDPLLKGLDGKQSSARVVVKNQSFLGYSKEVKKYVGPFFMASVMGNCVRHSNAVLNYSPKLVYKEGEVYASFMAGFVHLLQLAVLGTIMFNPLFRMVVAPFLPQPGSGPSVSFMDKGWLRITGFGKGSGGGRAKAVIYFPTDAGYRDTARMLVESGLVLALELNKVKIGGGIWTPASCQGELLLTRLVETGCSYYIE